MGAVGDVADGGLDPGGETGDHGRVAHEDAKLRALTQEGGDHGRPGLGVGSDDDDGHQISLRARGANPFRFRALTPTLAAPRRDGRLLVRRERPAGAGLVPEAAAAVRALLAEHAVETGSARAHRLLEHWDDEVGRFWVLSPNPGGGGR